jgi:hypothetical protein
MMTNSAPYDEASWGETLKNYRKTTNTLPWQKDAFVPTKRETVFEKSRKEREFNPVLMKYRDDSKERVVTQREKAFSAVRLNDAKDKQLCFEQKFDIINHKSYLPKEYEEASKKNAMMNEVRRKAPDTRLKYNLISHMGKVGSGQDGQEDHSLVFTNRSRARRRSTTRPRWCPRRERSSC